MKNSIGWLITLTPVEDGIQDAPIWLDHENNEFYVSCGRVEQIPGTLELNQISILDDLEEKPSSKLLSMGYRPKEIDE